MSLYSCPLFTPVPVRLSFLADSTWFLQCMAIARPPRIRRVKPVFLASSTIFSDSPMKTSVGMMPFHSSGNSRTTSLSRSHDIIVALSFDPLKFTEFATRKLDQESSQDSFSIFAARVNTMSRSYLDATCSFVDVTMQSQERLVLLDHFSHGLRSHRDHDYASPMNDRVKLLIQERCLIKFCLEWWSVKIEYGC